jgi:hypothetical protein
MKLKRHTRWLLSGALIVFIICAVLVGTGVVFLRQSGAELLTTLAAQKGIVLAIDRWDWSSGSSFELHNVRLGPEGEILRLEHLALRWDWVELLTEKRFSELRITRPEVWVSKLSSFLQKLERTEAKTAQEGAMPYVLDRVTITEGLIHLDKLRPGLGDIQVPMGQGRALELSQVPLGSAAFLDQDKSQETLIENVLITSPFDPLTRVLNFPAIRLTFTWAGLLRQEIDRVALINPTVYLGPDIFWFMDQFKTQTPEGTQPQPVSDQPAWTVRNFELRGGQLVVSAFGDPGVALPFFFSSSAIDVRLDRIEQLSLENKIDIAAQIIEYPDYQFRIELDEGKLLFNLPPEEKDAQNLVQKIHLKRVSWRDIEATDVWTSITFNKKGIFAKVGGQAYAGYLNGEIAVSFDQGYPWSAWHYVTKVDLAPIVKKLTQDRFPMELTGRASGRLEVKARATQILETTAELQLIPPGHLRLPSLKKLAENLPEDWNSVKKGMVKALADSFQEFAYQQAKVQANYRVPVSTARVQLEGDRGRQVLNFKWTQDLSLPPLGQDPRGKIDLSEVRN